MQEVLDLNDRRTNVVTPLSHGGKLVSADFHGAEVEVVRSRCASRVGLKGIVVRDSKFTFVVVTEKDEMKSESIPILSLKDVPLSTISWRHIVLLRSQIPADQLSCSHPKRTHHLPLHRSSTRPRRP